MASGRLRIGHTAIGQYSLQAEYGQYFMTGNPLVLTYSGNLFWSGYIPTVFAAPTAQGNGSGSSEANAMALSTAMTSISTGVVGLVPGVYSGTPSLERWIPIFAPSFNGTAGSPLVFTAKYPAVYNTTQPSLLSEFRSNNPQPVGTGQNSAVLGVGLAVGNYVRFVGVYASQVFAPPRPSNGTFLISPNRVGVVFENCWLEQITHTSMPDNWDSFFLEGCVDPIIRNCLISGGTGSGNHNYSAITTYGVTNFLFENLQFDDVNEAIFVKGSAFGATVWNTGTIRRCRIKNASSAAIDMAEVQPGGNVLVEENLIIGGTFGIVFDNSGNTALNRGKRVWSNTIVGFSSAGSGIIADPGALTDMQIKNNLVAVFAGNPNLVNYQASSTAGTDPLDWNHYFRQGGAASFGGFNQNYASLALWRTATGKEALSTEGDPLFVNVAADDFHLQVGSPALTGADDAGPRGCYKPGVEPGLLP